MSIDPAIVQRLSQSIAVALEQALGPLRQEVEALREEVSALRARAGEPAAPREVRTSRAASTARTARGSNRSLTCLVPGCPAPVLAKQLCETHYRVMRRSAAAGESFDAARQRPAGVRAASRGCRESGCKEAHYAKGLCRRHYMAARARTRAEEGRSSTHSRPFAVISSPSRPPATAESEADETTPGGDESTRETSSTGELDAPFDLAIGGAPGGGIVAMPTAEMVRRVVKQHRGNYWKVGEVLGRSPQSVKQLLYQLNVLDWAKQVREEECRRIKSSPLKERLENVLRRARVLEDLECLKEVDETAQHEVLVLCGRIARSGDTQDEVLLKLGRHLGLDVDLTRRLANRYQLRRHFARMRLKPAASARSRV